MLVIDINIIIVIDSIGWLCDLLIVDIIVIVWKLALILGNQGVYAPDKKMLKKLMYENKLKTRT